MAVQQDLNRTTGPRTGRSKLRRRLVVVGVLAVVTATSSTLPPPHGLFGHAADSGVTSTAP
ncbi:MULTISPECIES: hypothetical protein [Actinomadura]|uniref:Uncharacterized protein n=1 Tax=Actinomadura yumaensis TaxID=111807 RepID=A0ABW2CVR0_9ACTN|nr:hypothetical protein [Actinomadura sp. J1-007]MWK35060.1 hypothetical protein [Actinomadura sp. J1-007]